MAQSVTGALTVRMHADETVTNGLGSSSIPIEIQPAFSFVNGTGLGAMNYQFSNSYTLNAGNSRTVTLTLSALTDSLGRSVPLAKVRAILVYLTTTTSGSTMTVGNAGSNPFLGPLGGTTPTYTLQPGGVWLAVAPSAAGYTVTASSADQIKFNSGSNDVTFQLFIWGE